MQLYGKTDIKYAVAARANETPMGGVAVFFEDAVKAVFIAAFRANLERVFELDLFYFSIHHITCFTPRPKENNQPQTITDGHRRLFAQSRPKKRD